MQGAFNGLMSQAAMSGLGGAMNPFAKQVHHENSPAFRRLMEAIASNQAVIEEDPGDPMADDYVRMNNMLLNEKQAIEHAHNTRLRTKRKNLNAIGAGNVLTDPAIEALKHGELAPTK